LDVGFGVAVGVGSDAAGGEDVSDDVEFLPWIARANADVAAEILEDDFSAVAG
jgi:hypothetical protein